MDIYVNPQMYKIINENYIDTLKKMMEIRQFVKSENLDKRTVSLEDAKEKWKDFEETHKNLFEMCVNKEMDFNKIVYMFRLKTLVAEGKITDYDASVVHGKMVYDSYISS